MTTDVVGRIDAEIGAIVEDANRRHHVRRLTRVGLERALGGGGTGWARDPSTREGNLLEVYIDGASALPAIAAAVRSARSFVHIAGWTVNPEFAMERDGARVTLRALLAEAANRVDVRVLVWAGAPVPVMHPSRREARRLMDGLVRGTAIRGALDSRNRPMHCHHEKLVIIDGLVAFVGGIDLTDLSGDLFDGHPHANATRLGWHDVAAALSGPSVADVASHFAMRLEATTGERLPRAVVPAPTGQSRVQVIRTVPERTYAPLPHGDFSILEAYLAALRGAKRLIYLENQFLWSTEVASVLREKLTRPPHDDFRMCLLLPRHPNNGNDDTRGQLGMLQAADRHHRLIVGTIGSSAGTKPGVYVHAKVGVIDDQWLTIGSANLNEHSFFNDTEVNVITDDAAVARRVRERLWSEHLGQECGGRPALEVLETAWRPLLSLTPPYSAPLQPIPAVSRRSARLLGPLKGLLVDG